MSHGEPPLIDKPHYICTTDLMILLMSGVANGNVGAFDPMGKEFKIETKLGIGMLSSAVIEAKIPINEGLLNPSTPVWILHGGDHFTVGFLKEWTDEETKEMFHWNGLPPNRGMSVVEIKGKKTVTKVPTFEEFKKTHAEYKEVPGQIYDVV
jgi:hypothetical protein